MKVTMNEIAKLAGVSKATVSRVLNNSENGVGEETRKRVLQIAEQLHYSVGSNIKAEPLSGFIALILPNISNPFFANLALVIEREARLAGYATVLSISDYSEENELSQLRELVLRQPDGIILVPSGTEIRNEHFLPGKYRIPLVLLDRKLSGNTKLRGVYSNNEYAAVVSCDSLIQNGSKEIVFISGPLDVSTSIERFEGYKAVLSQYDIPYRKELYCQGNYTFESGYNAIIELERSGVHYSAILAANDLMALGALKAVREFGYRVPDDVEIIGFDNIEFSQYCDPALSTVQQPTGEMGRKTMEVLLRLIHNEDTEQPERLIPKLVKRKTTR